MISWTTEALATLRYRDRYSQEDILKDFTLKAVDHKLITISDTLSDDECYFVAPVLNGKYRVVWFAPNKDQIVAVAITKKKIRTKSDLDNLISEENWDWVNARR